MHSSRIPMLSYVAAAVCFVFSINAAHAHGDKHVASAKVDYSKAEDMPFGIAADPRKAVRTLEIEMADSMRFTPSEISVKRGENVRFVVSNKGKVMPWR